MGPVMLFHVVNFIGRRQARYQIYDETKKVITENLQAHYRSNHFLVHDSVAARDGFALS
ncbi:hypothetical protein L208DRAFT_1419137 [Tricholoma matsutake]|nr:hypothetical protein L208DRAFT_1419137 [Tricholoma matsutake 945]